MNKRNNKKRYQEALADLDMATKTDIELSKQLGVSDRQIRRYKTEPDFWTEVAAIRAKNLKGKSTVICKAVYLSALKGNVRAQELFLTMSGDYVKNSKVHLNRLEPVVITKEDEKEIDRILSDLGL